MAFEGATMPSSSSAGTQAVEAVAKAPSGSGESSLSQYQDMAKKLLGQQGGGQGGKEEKKQEVPQTPLPGNVGLAVQPPAMEGVGSPYAQFSQKQATLLDQYVNGTL